MLHYALVNISYNCIKLEHVIHIMLTTLSWFKIVVYIKLLMHMGIYRICCLLYPAPFKLVRWYSFCFASPLTMLRTFNIVGYLTESELNN